MKWIIFLGRVPEQVVVLDEAYYEFAEDFAAARGVKYSHSLDYVREGRNVVVLADVFQSARTGRSTRGYGIASAELIARISRQRSMYCVSALAQAGALAALEDSAHIRKAVENNTEEAQRLFRAIAEIGYAVTSDLGKFSLLRDRAGMPETLRNACGRGNFGTPARAMGRSRSHSHHHRHAGAE